MDTSNPTQGQADGGASSTSVFPHVDGAAPSSSTQAQQQQQQQAFTQPPPQHPHVHPPHDGNAQPSHQYQMQPPQASPDAFSTPPMHD